MQKVEITKRIADTGAMAIVRVQTVERGYVSQKAAWLVESTVWRSATPFQTQVR